MINYQPFWNTLKLRGISTYTLREKYKLSPSLLMRLKRDGNISMKTMNDLCKILNCRVEDIALYVPD